MPSEQELADMERMSNDYVPDVTGPLIGSQQSTSALTDEYAQADPVYVHKTRALPAKFSHYRTLRGDGNCGWRVIGALAFGYFETLLRLGDAAKIRVEAARLRSCNTMLLATGFSEDAFDLFVDETVDLLEKTAASLPNHDGGASLLTAFNDAGRSSAITYHFRLLTSAWMKTYPDIYAGFLTGVDVNTYCHQNIEPFTVELDHLGLQCLATAVINEAGIAIEVLYLDRSEGEEVNSIHFPVLDGQGKVVQGAPTIRLLYRPGHYDLLYKSEDVTEMAIGASRNPEVRLVSEPQMDTFATFDFSPTADFGAYMADLPGFTLGTPLPSFSSSLYQTPTQTCSMPSIPSPITTATSTLAHTHLNIPTSEPQAPSNPPTSSPSPENVNEIRFRGSEYQYSYQNCRARLRSQQLQAGFSGDNPDMTKKEDPSHYTNEAFQPQMWQPGSDYETDTSGKGLS
ncbi:hypothetical protein ACLMJK_009052 [Lecanora helva]